MDGENQQIARICTSSSLDGCLTGIGPTHIGLNYLSDMLGHETTEPKDVIFPFTVLEFGVQRGDPSVMLPGKVARYVPDAFLSDECWITEPSYPSAVERLWLTDGTIVETGLLLNGKKYRYLCLEDSVWSHTPQPARKAFAKEILAAAHEWLQQN